MGVQFSTGTYNNVPIKKNESTDAKEHKEYLLNFDHKFEQVEKPQESSGWKSFMERKKNIEDEYNKRFDEIMSSALNQSYDSTSKQIDAIKKAENQEIEKVAPKFSDFG